MSIRLAIGHISHETNTFSPIKTGLDLFKLRGIQTGDDIFRANDGVASCVGGFMDRARQAGADMIGLVSGSTVPSGTVSAEAYNLLKNTLLSELRSALPVDAVLVALHGAMVAESCADCEGDILAAVRELVGANIPVVATLDFHANVTDRMIAAADALFSYNTYPHVDNFGRGVEAAELALQMINGQTRPAMAVCRPPLVPCLPTQFTGAGVMKELMDLGFAWEKDPRVIDVTVLGGFPYSDIYDAGLSVIAITRDDRALAQQIADELGAQAWEWRHRFVPELPSATEAVSAAIAAPVQPGRPIVMAEVADNPGGGGSGDGTPLLAELLRQGAQNTVFGVIADPEAVAAAVASGVGTTVRLKLGAKTDRFHGEPLDIEAKVRLIHDGNWAYRGPMLTGARNANGVTVVLQAGGVEIVVTERRHQPLDPELFRVLGIEPTQRHIVAVKSAVHFRAGFSSFASQIIEVDGPGLVPPDLRRLPYEHVRRPIFPLEM